MPMPRRSTNPVFNDRKLKLGTFGTNLDRGCATSTIDGVLKINWPNTLELARISESMEFEALVPIGRWHGFGGSPISTARDECRRLGQGPAFCRQILRHGLCGVRLARFRRLQGQGRLLPRACPRGIRPRYPGPELRLCGAG